MAAPYLPEVDDLLVLKQRRHGGYDDRAENAVGHVLCVTGEGKQENK